MARPMPLLIGHRGASFDAPENTLAAFELAFEQGADGIEGDFHLTRDRQVVCIHDPTTRRTAGADRIVADSTLAELKQFDVGAWKDPKFTGQRIPNLDQVLAILPAGKRLFIEVKTGPEILSPIAAAIAGSSVRPEQIRLMSFDAKVVAQAAMIVPSIKTHWLIEYSDESFAKNLSPDAILQTLIQTRAAGLNSQASLTRLTPAFLARCHEMSMETQAWTVDDPALARALTRAGIDALTTNRPGYLRKAIAED